MKIAFSIVLICCGKPLNKVLYSFTSDYIGNNHSLKMMSEANDEQSGSQILKQSTSICFNAFKLLSNYGTPFMLEVKLNSEMVVVLRTFYELIFNTVNSVPSFLKFDT